MIGCDAENPGEPDVNLAPDTYFSEISPGNQTSISFYGTDEDGFVQSFEYQWLNDVNWSSTTDNTITFSGLFASQDDTLIFYVKSIDNEGLEDPTPAEIALTPQNVLPETEITDGPQFGQTTGEDVSFAFSGTDSETGGSIVKFEYTIDQLNSWRETPVDFPQATFLGLPTGGHIFYVRAVDNLGGKDLSPAQVAFIVKGGQFAPEIVMQSSITNDDWLFANGTILFSWEVLIVHYQGLLPEAPYSTAIDDTTNFDQNPNTALANGWSANPYLYYVPQVGSHTFYLKVRDTAGGISLESIRFNVASLSVDQGVLVVNGVNPDFYGDEITSRIAQGAYWGQVDVDFWDLFGTESTPHPAITLPGGVDYLGGAAIPASTIGAYSTILWLGNNAGGDLDYWNPTLMMAYLNAGGNIILATRQATEFLSSDLSSYLNISWREEGATIQECISVFPGMVDLVIDTTSGYQSGCSIFSGSGFLNSLDDNTVTNWDSVSSYTKSDLTTTLLFAHRSNTYDPLFPFGFVRGLGVWSHPNFSFSSTNAGDEFPQAGTDQATGNFILISARNYRFDIATTTANFEFMLNNMCGE
jgi:hypothetical protein